MFMYMQHTWMCPCMYTRIVTLIQTRRKTGQKKRGNNIVNSSIHTHTNSTYSKHASTNKNRPLINTQTVRINQHAPTHTRRKKGVSTSCTTCSRQNPSLQPLSPPLCPRCWHWTSPCLLSERWWTRLCMHTYACKRYVHARVHASAIKFVPLCV